jgi:hypothetical protein
MQFDTSTLELESLLGTEYYIYKHVETGKATIGSDE